MTARSADAEEEDVPAGQEDADDAEEPKEEEDDAATADKVGICEVDMTPDQVAAINRMHIGTTNNIMPYYYVIRIQTHKHHHNYLVHVISRKLYRIGSAWCRRIRSTNTPKAKAASLGASPKKRGKAAGIQQIMGCSDKSIHYQLV